MTTRLVSILVGMALIVLAWWSFSPGGLLDRWHARSTASWIAADHPSEDQITARLGQPQVVQGDRGTSMGFPDFSGLEERITGRAVGVKKVWYYHGRLSVDYDRRGQPTHVGFPLGYWGDQVSGYDLTR